MYDKCNYAIKARNEIGKIISSNTGVKQGCTLSPTLSNIYQNDLHEIFNDSCSPFKFQNINVNSLSWADDLMLISTTPNGLQNCINRLNDYCSKWNLTINSEKTKCMIFGKSKKCTFKYNNLTIEQVNQYKYLGVIIQKNGKTKMAIEDRINKAKRAINMLQGALSTNGNVSPSLALSLFDKQIYPILTYGSIYWGLDQVFNKLFINDVHEKNSNVKELNSYLKTNSIQNIRKVQAKNNRPNHSNLLITTNSYASKVELLNYKNISSRDITKQPDDHPYEKIHTRFIKFALSINKFSSNYATRAEVGRFPIELNLIIKLIKYWHRLENLDYQTYPILTEAYQLCKLSEHSWILDIYNFLNINGMMYIKNDPKLFTEFYIADKVTRTYECQYIQSWDSRARDSTRYLSLCNIKSREYSFSPYLCDIQDIDSRVLVSKLRIGCSKFKNHRFLGRNEDTSCMLCNESSDSIEHLLVSCTHKTILDVRNKHFTNLESVYPKFKHLTDENKICSIMNLSPQNPTTPILKEYMHKCINFLKELYNVRFEKPSNV